MFKCKACSEKDKVIEYLKSQNKDLMDRLMAYSKEALYTYKKEEGELPTLYPQGIDSQGKLFDHKDFDPEKAEQEVLTAMGEDFITMELKDGE